MTRVVFIGVRPGEAELRRLFIITNGMPNAFFVTTCAICIRVYFPQRRRVFSLRPALGAGGKRFFTVQRFLRVILMKRTHAGPCVGTLYEGEDLKEPLFFSYSVPCSAPMAAGKTARRG